MKSGLCCGFLSKREMLNNINRHVGLHFAWKNVHPSKQMNRLLQVLRAGRAQVPRSRATLPEKVPGVTGGQPLAMSASSPGHNVLCTLLTGSAASPPAWCTGKGSLGCAPGTCGLRTHGCRKIQPTSRMLCPGGLGQLEKDFYLCSSPTLAVG